MSTRLPSSLDPLHASVQQWNAGTLAAQTLWTRGLGPDAVAAAARQRWAALARHARAHSPFYRKRWRHLPAGDLAPADVPVVTKDELMASFDDWCTDRAIAWRDVAAFLATRAHIGERFRGDYFVWTSSGTTGRPGRIPDTRPPFSGCINAPKGGQTDHDHPAFVRRKELRP